MDSWMDTVSLRMSLVLSVVLPVLVALGLVSYIAFQAIERQAKEQMEEDVQLVARAIQLPLGRALDRGREGSVENALESAFSINRVYGAYVYNMEGDLISSVGGFRMEPDRGRLSTLAEEGDRQGEYEEIGGRVVYSYFVPLTGSGGRLNGLLQITRHANDIQQYLTTLRWQAGGLLGITMLLIAGLVLYGHRRAIGAYLSRLSETMASVERGDLECRADLRGPREIASLAGALNTMLESIEQAQDEIVERRQTQVRLERRLQHAEKLAAIGQLSAGVAHELGTPLSVIDGKAQRALRNDDLPDDLTDVLQSIRDEVERMEHIVRQLLDFGRRHTLERSSVSLNRIVQMAVGGIQDTGAQSEVEIDVVGDRPAPVVEVDPTLMERALANLLRNAVEATPGGHVRVSWFASDEEIGLVVEDDGPGIQDDIQSRVFEPFFTTKSVGQGTGLGLAVVHGVVEEHGGSVEVGDSELGGAQFRIVLPGNVVTEEATEEVEATPA